MNLALVVAEAGDGMKPLEMNKEKPSVTHEEIVESLNIEFVREFNQTPLNQEILHEFVFALDHLKELTRTENYPNNRLLNTPDIATTGSAAVCVFNDFAKRAHDPTMYGCAIGTESMKNIAEFFEYDYLKTIARILKNLKRDFIMVTLDGESLNITLKQFTPHPEFGLLTYSNYGEETVAAIPFHLTRIIDA